MRTNVDDVPLIAAPSFDHTVESAQSGSSFGTELVVEMAKLHGVGLGMAQQIKMGLTDENARLT